MRKDEINRELINKMLEPLGINYDNVSKNPFIGNMVWNKHYQFVSEEHQKDFEEYAVQYFMDKYNLSRKDAEYEYAWFELKFGLKKA